MDRPLNNGKVLMIASHETGIGHSSQLTVSVTLHYSKSFTFEILTFTYNEVHKIHYQRLDIKNCDNLGQKSQTK